MADPRGLSGAVFQQTPVRDFIGDLQRQQQLTGQAISQANKAKDDFFKQYGDVKVDGVPAPYLPSYMQAVDSYRQDARRVFAETDPIKRREGEMMLDVKRNQLRIGREMAKDRYKTGAAYKGYLDEHGNKLAEDDKAIKFQTTQNFLTPQEQFNWGEDGALYFGDKTAAERTSENVLWGVPEDAPLTAWERINKRDGFNEQTLGVPQSDGSFVLSKPKASRFFAIERRRGSDEYKDYLIEAVRQDTGQTVSADEAMDMLQTNPEYDAMAEELFLEEAEVNFLPKGARADGRDRGGIKPLNETKGRYYQLGANSEEMPNAFGVGFSPSDNIKVSAELDVDVLDEDGNPKKNEAGKIETTTKLFKLDVSDIVEKDGQLYMRAFDRASTEFIPIGNREKAQLEEQLNVESLEDWYQFKKTKNKPSEQPIEQEQEKVEETDVVEGEEEILVNPTQEQYDALPNGAKYEYEGQIYTKGK